MAWCNLQHQHGFWHGLHHETHGLQEWLGCPHHTPSLERKLCSAFVCLKIVYRYRGLTKKKDMFSFVGHVMNVHETNTLIWMWPMYRRRCVVINSHSLVSCPCKQLSRWKNHNFFQTTHLIRTNERKKILADLKDKSLCLFSEKQELVTSKSPCVQQVWSSLFMLH